MDMQSGIRVHNASYTLLVESVPETWWRLVYAVQLINKKWKKENSRVSVAGQVDRL